MVSGALHLGARATATADATAERLDRMRTAQAFLRNHLEAARPRLGLARETTAAFVGEAGELAFAAAVSPRRGGGVHWIRLFVAEREGVRELAAVRRLAPVRPRSPDTPEGAPIVLVSDIAEARFAYYGAVPPDAPPRWHERWAGEVDLPLLIRIEVAFCSSHLTLK